MKQTKPRIINLTAAQPFTIRQEFDPRQEEQYLEAKINRSATLRTARLLNYITVVGILATLAGLIFIYLGFVRLENQLQLLASLWIKAAPLS